MWRFWALGALLALTATADLLNLHQEDQWDDNRYNRIMLQQYRDDDPNFNFHEIGTIKAKREVTGPECPPGYTGLYCESPICTNKTEKYIVDHSEEVLLDAQVSDSCSAILRLNVDSHVHGEIRIVVYTHDAAKPSAMLHSPKGDMIFPEFHHETGNDHTYTYRRVITRYGPGVYTIRTSSEDDENCAVTVFASAEIRFYGGFDWNVHNDDLQTLMPDGQKVQRMPTQYVPSYLSFTLSNLSYHEQPEYIAVERAGVHRRHDDAPMKVGTRYNCLFNSFVGPYSCRAPGAYFLKIRGRDDSGVIYQRIFSFVCEHNRNIPDPPTSPAPPIDRCENGGILVTSGDEPTCYCGPFFHGRICEKKNCLNGGTLEENGDCKCEGGFGGTFCQHVRCEDRANVDFSAPHRAITFIVHTRENSDVREQIKKAAQRIFAHYNDIAPGMINRYFFIPFVDGDIQRLFVAGSQDDFIEKGIMNLKNWKPTANCVDGVWESIVAALDMMATYDYLKAPIFLFTDALPNDLASTVNDARALLSAFRSPVYTILYGGGSDTCDVKVRDPGYDAMRELAQMTHGLTVKTSTKGDEISDAAFRLAESVYEANLLTANDLLDSCRFAPNQQLFFVDETVAKVSVGFVGNGISLKLVDPEENAHEPTSTQTVGDYTVDTFDTLVKGHYRMVVETHGLTDPCHYRVYAQTAYASYIAASSAMNIDLDYLQPILNEDIHIVATVANAINHTTPWTAQRLNAQVVVWTNGDQVDGDKRELLYASNGIYRDGCDYDLYFGAFKCTKAYQTFYANIFITDSAGFTVQRTTTGHCSTRRRQPTADCENGGVRYQGKCLCPAGWEGPKCHQIVCENGGISKGDYCECYNYLGGRHCEQFRCLDRNPRPEFSVKEISFALVVQNSLHVRSAVLQMGEVASQVVRNIQSGHPEWIKDYTFWLFDEKETAIRGRSPHAETIIDQVQNFATKLATGSLGCKDMKVFDVLLDVFKHQTSTQNMIVYLYVYGGLELDKTKEREVYELMDQLDATINVIQHPSPGCFRADAPEMVALASLAEYSGGFYSQSNQGATLLTLPFHYSKGTFFEEYRDSCLGKQTFYFPVDAETQSLNVYVTGNIYGDVVFKTPSGVTANEYRVYFEDPEFLFTVTKPCPDGWYPLGHHCYRFMASDHTWEEAKEQCGWDGGYIITVDSDEVTEFLRKFAGPQDIWIGLNDQRIRDVWEWDQGKGEHVPLSDYVKWAAGEPRVNNGKCVASTKNGWVVTPCDQRHPFACTIHAYDLEWKAGGSNQLDLGVWSLEFTAFEGEDAEPCGARIDGQSTVQVYRRFLDRLLSDEGRGQAYLNSYNWEVSHVEADHDEFAELAVLEYAHYYTKKSTELSVVTDFSRREDCSYEYLGTPFLAREQSYHVGYTGFDAYGYPFQRILPTVALEQKTECRNGGKRGDGPWCICPPRYVGNACQSPVCGDYGRLHDNKVICDCDRGFDGPFCEKARCLRGGGKGPDPITNKDKTFALIVDGSWTGNNKGFLENFNNIVSKTLAGLGKVEKHWFKNFVGIVAYDKEHKPGGFMSKVVRSEDREDFIKQLKVGFLTELPMFQEILDGEKYTSKGSERAYQRALTTILNYVEVGSYITIIGDSAMQDADVFNIDNQLALRHVAINVIVLSDTAPPGGKRSYRDSTVLPLLDRTFVTGGGFYQISDHTHLLEFWTMNLVSSFSSYGIIHSAHLRCDGRSEYFQIGTENTNLIVDIFYPGLDAPGKVVKPDKSEAKSTGFVRSKTNFFFPINTQEPGVWTLSTPKEGKSDFCIIQVRAVKNDAPAVGFNQDVAMDRGYHSRESSTLPVAGVENSIIAHAETGDVLTYAQIYDHGEGHLAFSTQLIPRDFSCTWNYVSKDLFHCPSESFTVAVEGYDRSGHPFRRTYKTHCKDFRRPQRPGGGGRPNNDDIFKTLPIEDLTPEQLAKELPSYSYFTEFFARGDAEAPVAYITTNGTESANKESFSQWAAQSVGSGIEKIRNFLSEKL